MGLLPLSLLLALIAGPVPGPTSGSWTRKNAVGYAQTTVPEFTPRHGAAGFAIGNIGYITGGGVDLKLMNDTWSFDPATAVWTQKADLPGVPRANMAVFVLSNKGYLCGGNTSTLTRGGAPLDAVKELWMFDPLGNTWTRKADLGGDARYSAVGFVVGTMGYVAMGMMAAGEGKDLWRYDPATDVWTRKADFE